MSEEDEANPAVAAMMNSLAGGEEDSRHQPANLVSVELEKIRTRVAPNVLVGDDHMRLVPSAGTPAGEDGDDGHEVNTPGLNIIAAVDYCLRATEATTDSLPPSQREQIRALLHSSHPSVSVSPVLMAEIARAAHEGAADISPGNAAVLLAVTASQAFSAKMFAAVVASQRETQDLLRRVLQSQARTKTLSNCSTALTGALRQGLRASMIVRPLALIVQMGEKGRKVLDVLLELVPAHETELLSLVEVERDGKRLIGRICNELVGAVWAASQALAQERSRFLAHAASVSAYDEGDATTEAPAAKMAKRDMTDAENKFLENLASCTVMNVTVSSAMNEHAAHMHVLFIGYATANYLGWKGGKPEKTFPAGAPTLDEIAPKVDPRSAAELTQAQSKSARYARSVISPRTSGDLAAFVLIVIQTKIASSGRLEVDSKDLQSRFFVFKKQMEDSASWTFFVPSVKFHGDYADYAKTLDGVAKVDFESSLEEGGDIEANSRAKIPSVSTLTGLSRKLYDRSSMSEMSKSWWWRLEVAV